MARTAHLAGHRFYYRGIGCIVYRTGDSSMQYSDVALTEHPIFTKSFLMTPGSALPAAHTAKPAKLGLSPHQLDSILSSSRLTLRIIDVIPVRRPVRRVLRLRIPCRWCRASHPRRRSRLTSICRCPSSSLPRIMIKSPIDGRSAYVVSRIRPLVRGRISPVSLLVHPSCPH